MTYTRCIAMLLIAVFLTSCASIISDSNYNVGIRSNPSGAAIMIENRFGEVVYNGTTPTSVNLDASAGFFRGEQYQIIFTIEGYESRTYALRSEIDGWYFANLLLGGIIGMLFVDPMTGAMYQLPENVSQTLTSSESLTIHTIDDLTKEQISLLEEIPPEN